MAKSGTLRNKKVLITCGPTWVPIDAVRVISNRSTGEMGHQLARDFQRGGAKVTLLEGPCTDFFTGKRVTVRKFHFYDELRGLLRSELKKKFDIIVHAAAVSDYQLRNPYPGKLRSRISKLNLVLVPTPKLIDEIRRLAPQSTLVGFKLEPAAAGPRLRKKGEDLARQADCDYVVANSLKGHYQGQIISGEGEVVATVSSRAALSQKLIKILKDYA